MRATLPVTIIGLINRHSYLLLEMMTETPDVESASGLERDNYESGVLPKKRVDIQDTDKVMGQESLGSMKVMIAMCLKKLTDVCVKWKVTILAWITLIMSIVSGSAIGPMFKYMEVNGVPALVGECYLVINLVRSFYF